MRAFLPKTFRAAIVALTVLIGFSACEEVEEAHARITVLENQPDPQKPGDFIAVPAVQATVEIYSIMPGTTWLKQTLTTDTNGEVEFSHDDDAILNADITHGTKSLLVRSLTLKKGETAEFVFNLDEQ